MTPKRRQNWARQKETRDRKKTALQEEQKFELNLNSAGELPPKRRQDWARQKETETERKQLTGRTKV